MFARMFEGAWWAFGGAKPPQAPPPFPPMSSSLISHQININYVLTR